MWVWVLLGCMGVVMPAAHPGPSGSGVIQATPGYAPLLPCVVVCVLMLIDACLPACLPAPHRYDSIWTCASCPPGFVSLHMDWPLVDTIKHDVPVCMRCDANTYSNEWGRAACSSCTDPARVYGTALQHSAANFSAAAAVAALGIALPVTFDGGISFTATTLEAWETRTIHTACHACAHPPPLQGD